MYDLGGQEVIVNEERAVLKDGTLAGSILKLNDAVRNMMKFTDCSLQDIRVRLGVPALSMGRDPRGRHLHGWAVSGSWMKVHFSICARWRV